MNTSENETLNQAMLEYNLTMNSLNKVNEMKQSILDNLKTETEKESALDNLKEKIETAKVELEKEMVANIVALGVMNEIIDSVDSDMLKKAILARVPKGTEELNEKAFELGSLLVKGR